MARNQETLAFPLRSYTVFIQVNTDNAAFHDDASGDYAPESELTRIRLQVASKLRSTLDDLDESDPDAPGESRYEGNVRDINGNTVGTWIARKDS